MNTNKNWFLHLPLFVAIRANSWTISFFFVTLRDPSWKIPLEQKLSAKKETFRRGREGFFVVPRPKLEPRPKFGIRKTWR
jgi:hypothetical protein